MKRFVIGFGWLVAACAAVAGTGTSNEFRLDTCTGVRTAATTEKIQYSTAWATNLTAAQQGESKAVVKVNPCLKTPPKYLVVDMSGGRSATRWPISHLDEVPSGGWTDEYKTEKLVLRYIPAGSFIMGGRATDYPGAVNTNLHMVTLTKPFYIGVFECTQRQWELAMGNRPSFFTNETCYATRPVDRVSYLDIRGNALGGEWPKHMMVDDGSFLGVVRAKTGNLLFDLPTDAQWEYACRAGTVTALNSGRNLTGEMDCENMNEVARYRFNSNNDTLTQVEKANCTAQYCSAKVGSYMPNEWGIFDLHGNLWEHCLDRALSLAVGSIDPVGGNDTALTKRVIRGGGYNENAWRCRSAFRYADTYGHGYSQTGRGSTVGFRICLHNATVYPSADSATILVNATGASAVDWTPTQAGTYQLTHEVQVDGATIAPMESALFKIEGPELKIMPMGELTNGVLVKVEKVGGGEQWNIYYSLDGSTPTAGSTKYEGPFELPETATVKAVAISPSGVSSEVANKELALHPALAVEDTKARQRWPWNDKVDVDCEVAGDSEKSYRVTFAVSDEVGGTNLPIRTVWKANEPSVTNCEYIVSPGKYRFVWDAAADLPKGTRFGGVSVSIDAEPSPMAGWKRVVTISTDGYAGNETLTDVPVLVRLSSAIEGFNYADFAAPDTGADMIFTDMEGTARYPYEIDEWHKDGESLVWVKLPELKKGTKFLLAYGWKGVPGAWCLVPGAETAAKHEVWKEYAGVWHMNEDSGTAFDSTEHGLDALPDWGTNKTVDVRSEMVGVQDGAVGVSRQNQVTEFVNADGRGNYMLVPNYDALALGGRFVCSGWFKAKAVLDYPRMISRKRISSDKNGWEVHPRQNSYTNMSMRGSTSGSMICATPDLNRGWVSVVCVYDHLTYSCYTNGILSGVLSDANTVEVVDNGAPLAFGCNSSGSEDTWCGWYDEIRLRGGTLSAGRIKADYDMIANRNFCTYGKVEAGPGADPVPPSTTYRVRFNANGGSGTMEDEVFEVGVAKALTANAFVRDGYAFEGWATSDGGAKVYSDKQSVSDLTTPGAMVNLYAVWKEALYMVVDLSGGSSAASYPVSYLNAVPNGGWTDEYKTTKLVLRLCEAGTFNMQGTISTTLTKAFYMGVFEVTQKQFNLIYGRYTDNWATAGNGVTYAGDTRPAYNVSYDRIRGNDKGGGWPSSSAVDDNSFLGKLRAKTGKSFDLPTEAQWERACRAGGDLPETKTAYGRFSTNKTDGKGGYSEHTKVGVYQANAWGIFDMLGNVCEWCLDGWNDLPGGTDPTTSTLTGFRVLRGGSWYFAPASGNIAQRWTENWKSYAHDDGYYSDVGFRIVLPL